MAQKWPLCGTVIAGVEEVALARLLSGIPKRLISGLWLCLLVSFLSQQVSGSELALH